MLDTNQDGISSAAVELDKQNLNLSPAEIEAMKLILQAHGIRFTEQLQEREIYNENPPEKLNKLLIVDTETTGPDSKVDKIIELGALLVEYAPDTGEFYRVVGKINQLEDPGMPISPEATKVNGITDEMVAGHKIDDEEVNALVNQASVVSCHNSGFDRKFLEKRFPVFIDKPFACSFKQIDWVGEGYGSGKLEFILYKIGYHYEGHRAVNDCYALLAALQSTLPTSGKNALLAMLDNARVKEIDIAALATPFDSKDELKARKYQWFDDGAGNKYWHKPVSQDDVPAEIEWLASNIYKGKFRLQQTEVNSRVRFSDRTLEPTTTSH